MPTIDQLCVDAIELAHARRQIGLGCFDQQMVVVRHLAPGMDGPIEALATLCEGGQPEFTVGVVQKNILTTITARSDVIKTTGYFQSKGT